jgi:hypothetical protein
MKFGLFSTASALALIAAIGPASAGNDFTGVLQLNIGRASMDGTPFSDDPLSYGGKAKGLWPLSTDIHIQADVFAEENNDVIRNWAGPGSQDASLLGAAVHLLHPFENRARFGLAGSIWGTDVYGPFGSGRTDVTYGLAAVEGQFFGTDWTVMGQAGAFTSFDCDDGGECDSALQDGTFIRGKARYFLRDNTALTVEAVRMWGGRADDIFGLKALDYSQWVLEAEHRFQDSQFSIFGNVSHESFDSTNGTGVSIGVKFYLDEASLRSNDRNGAELDTPTFGHAPAVSGASGVFILP